MSDEPLAFYHSLQPVREFTQIFDPEHYQSVPSDWFVAVTDVVRSTEAIDAGRYKAVNVAGSLAVMAFANLRQGLDFPFAFGGDGMTIVLPGEYQETLRSLLADVRIRVRESFDLELRAGVVPVTSLLSQGAELSIGRLQVSEHYAQALFSGAGLDLAERLVKDPSTQNEFLVNDNTPMPVRANLEGFSCRWEDIPSRQGETVSLIVRPREGADERGALQQVLDGVAGVIGTDYHPLTVEGMTMATGRESRSTEASAMSGTQHGLRFAFRRFWIRVEMFFTWLTIAWHVPLKQGKKRLDLIREENVLSSDYRKFDGTLKMVVAVTHEQRTLLERVLRDLFEQGMINYGVHVSDRAIMTCYIHFGSGDEVHFVDAADGGYALAARALKAQLTQ